MVLQPEIQDPQLYADAFNIPRSISKPFLHDVQKWKRCSGTEWTVSRIKAMKLDFIRFKAGLDPVSVWISDSGPIKGLRNWCRDDWKRWSKAIQLLQIYTMYVSPQITELQEKKFLDGVTAPNTEIPAAITLGVRTSAYKLNLRRCIFSDPKPLVLRPLSSTRREPHASGRSFPEGEMTLECAVSYTRYTRIGWDLRSQFHDIFNFVEDGIDVEDNRDCDVTDYRNSVGKIGIIQEPGFKLRAVANPARVYQQALSPLGDDLYALLKELPWDCTFNQSKADEYIFQSLRDNRTCFCVDLSGATDYFPLDLQISALKFIYGENNQYVNLFAKLSRQPWQYGTQYIAWTRGQPLGLYPSFASFALTHGLLLYALNNYSHSGKFYILGDDVIILDESLYRKYRAVLAQLNCPVSEGKTLTSSKVAEFAGNLFLPHGKIPQCKWRRVSDDSFLDILRNIGPKALILLRPRQRRVAKLMFSVPDFMGGLGWNPKGIPLDDRVYHALSLFSKEKGLRFLMSYNRRVECLNYYDRRFSPPYRFVRIEKGVPDQGALAYVQRYLPSLINWCDILGVNLWSVKPDLPLAIEGQVNRSSKLQQLERTLLQ